MAAEQDFPTQLTAILVTNGAVSDQEAVSLKAEFKDRSQEAFDYFLLEEDLVSRSDLLTALGQLYDVEPFDVGGHLFDHDLVALFPKEEMISLCFIPLLVDENMMVVVANQPDDPELLEAIGAYVSYDVIFRVGLWQDIQDAVEEFSEESITITLEDEEDDLEDDEESEAIDDSALF